MTRRTEFAIYGAIAAAGVLPALLHPGAVVGDGVDAFGTHSFYWWMRVCVQRFADPSTSPFLFWPTGKEVFSQTGNNLVDAVLSVPFQWVLGPTLYQPVFIVVLLLGNAVAMRALARDVLGDDRAAFAATLLWMTNPYVIFEITEGRPTQALLWFVPAAILYFRRCAREPTWKNGVLLGVSVGLAGWTYWFNGYFVAFALAALAGFELRDARDRRGTLRRWALGVAVCAALVGPAAWWIAHVQVAGAVPGTPTTGGLFQVPSVAGEGVSVALRGLWLMERHGAPQLLQPAWGLPLLAAMLWPRLPLARTRWIVVLAVTLTIAIGPALTSREADIVWPPYMALHRHLPFFHRLWFPYRILGVTFVPACLLLGALCTRWRWMAGALAALSLAGQVAVATWPFNWHVASSPRMLTDLPRDRGAVIFLPAKIQHDGLMWQTEFQLPTFGGMGESTPLLWPPGFQQRLLNGFVRALRGGAMVPPQRPPFLPEERTTFEALGFRWVVLRLSLLEAEVIRAAQLRGVALDPMRSIADSITSISASIGHAPVGLEGDAVLWDLEGTWQTAAEHAYTRERLAEHHWSGELKTAFLLRLDTLGRAPPAPIRTMTPPPPAPRPIPGGRP